MLHGAGIRIDQHKQHQYQHQSEKQQHTLKSKKIYIESIHYEIQVAIVA
jgi:hypothetical protein